MFQNRCREENHKMNSFFRFSRSKIITLHSDTLHNYGGLSLTKTTNII